MTYVSHTNILNIAQQTQTQHTHATVEEDEGAAKMPLVAKVGESEHDNSGQDVRRCDEAL